MEMMIYAFGLGLSFIAGLALGGWLLGRMASGHAAKFADEAKTQRDMILAHHVRVENRLDGYVESSRDIAETLKKLLVRPNTQLCPSTEPYPVTADKSP